jgi:hypothetical protein
MKRSFLVSLFLGMAAAGSVWAEPYALPLPTLGIRGGIDIARERISGAPGGISNKSQTYGGAGINYEFSLYRPPSSPSMGLSMRTDLMWIRTGGKFIGSGITEKDRVDELRLAPFLVYRFAAQNFVPFAQAGPFVSYDLNHKYTTSGTLNNGTPISASGDIPNWRKSNFGLSAGLGFKVPTAVGSFSLDGRYSWGLINKNSSGSAASNSNLVDNGNGLKRHSDGVIIMAGYDFKMPSIW